MPLLYFSYRPQDAEIVERIVRRCLQTYGRFSVLMNPQLTCPDDTSIEHHIDNLMHGATAVLLVVGNDWAGVDEFGRFLLSSADIPVGPEVKIALRSQRQVIIVLVNGAALPAPDAVPDDLQSIYRLPVVELRPQSFYDDLNRLIPAPSLSDLLLYYLSFAWLKRYTRIDEDRVQYHKLLR